MRLSIKEIKNQEKERRRNYILDAAEKLFFSKGYDNVSMDDIANEVELSKAALYLYFKDKESLFFSIVLRGARILNAMIEEETKDCKNGVEILDAIGAVYFEFVNKYPDYNQAYLYFRSGRFAIEDSEDVNEIAKEILKLRQETFVITCNAIKSGIDEGLIRRDLNPVEMTIFLTLITKGIAEMRSDFKKVLEKQGISQYQFCVDVDGFIHHMLMNTERMDAETQKSTSAIDSSEKSKNRKDSSKMAELIALHRVAESRKPESERICYDPYAVHFVNPETLAFAAANPEKTKAMSEYYERLFPGLANSIRARVRYFDDFLKNSIDEGLEQLVILGAGYDTRAYRIEGLKGKIKVFEVDHPDTQYVKIEKIKRIFGFLPGHVTYVPVDFEIDNFGERLIEQGYNRSMKTLFILEGLIMYISRDAVDETLSFIAENSGKGSAILFDYYPESVVDGICELKKNMRDYAAQQGEPFKFGIKEGEVETFLVERGFSKIESVTSEDYKRMYFHGINASRAVSPLLYFAHAVIE
jgi:methyltransferase (TIGR00027 family)